MSDMYFIKPHGAMQGILRIVNDAGVTLSLAGDPINAADQHRAEQIFHRIDFMMWHKGGMYAHGLPGDTPEDFLERLAFHLGYVVQKKA